jgi:hypothetical protein
MYSHMRVHGLAQLSRQKVNARTDIDGWIRN